ncbi:hypothetical protein CRG98_010159 [Punica granatum]|uniref:Uncharacterized protein n=1 Tax=Punica granatum TaxID=22663 RepID=A0A2I0KNP9_PUNGR|nr:hypothetical protein CRG98_010159 [Punica granatum]
MLALTGRLLNTILAGSLGPGLWAVARAGCLRPISCNSTRAGYCGRLYGRGKAHNVFGFSCGGLQEKAFSRTKPDSRDISTPLLTVQVVTWAPDRHYMPSETVRCPSRFAWRNKEVFDPDFSLPESGTQAILHTALGFQDPWAAAWAMGGGSNKDWMDIRWLKPLEDFLKLNTDGYVRGNPGIVGADGLIRNDSVGWVIGFL